MNKLVIGCGYLGGRVADLWRQQGDTVYALTRRRERSEQLQRQGLLPLVGDWTDRRSLPTFPAVETALIAVGYDRSCGKSLHEVYCEGLRNALAVLPSSLGRLIFISSTGVYGQSQGQWIDERSPCEPTREGGKACLAAEQILAEHPLGERAVVLRLAGIYGPGRLPLASLMKEGKPLPVDSQARINLIQVEDAAEAVLAAERLATPPEMFLVSDGNPCRRGEFYRELARQFGLPEPTFQARPDQAGRGGDKRIRNQRMVDRLQVRLQYPTYREGLASSIASTR